jgi:hypothetical protein
VKSVYIETSVFSYLTARPSNDVTVTAWREMTHLWWGEARKRFELFVSELVVAEASRGDPEASQRRLDVIRGLPELLVDDRSLKLAEKLVAKGGFPTNAEADALHVAIAATQEVDYLLTWNCRRINNAETKPIIRSICITEGITCPEICTPQELLPEETDDVSR